MSARYFAATFLVLIPAWVDARPAVFLNAVHSSDPHHEHQEEGHQDSEKAIHEHVHDHISDHHDAVVEHIKNHDEDVAEHVHEHGDQGQECSGSANSVAVGLLTTVVLGPLLVYMTMSKAANGRVSYLTFKFIDLSTSIFLAVLWFSASSGVLETPALKHAFPKAEEVFAILQVLFLYCIAMAIAYAFRENKMYLLTFCGCAGHYIAFTAIKATGETQHKVQENLPEEHRLDATIGFCFLVFGIFFGLSLVSYFTFRKKVESDDFQEAVEELELDMTGLVVSFAIIQAVRHGLTGRYPPEAHMLLQQHAVASSSAGCSTMVYDGTVSHPHFEHTAEQRLYMLLFAMGLSFITLISLKKMENYKNSENVGYWMYKFVHVCQVVLVMSVAWGYLLWGEWQFYETYFHGDRMFGKMVFAILATSICLILTVFLAFAHETQRLQSYGGYVNLVVMAMSLVAAWSWEHCFHTALDVVAEQYQVGYGGLVPKLVIALAIPLIILPGYMVFLKPIVLENEEKFDTEEVTAVDKFEKMRSEGRQEEATS